MTKEQKEKALAFLKDMQECTYDGVEEIKTAIESLEQQSDDCVSREKVWYMITGGKYANEDYEQFIDRLVNELENMPPVTPTQNWVPVSERLPNIKNRTEKYLVTLKDKTVSDAMFTECDRKHWWSYDYDDVIAWMPLPKPYEEKRGNLDGSN